MTDQTEKPAEKRSEPNAAEPEIKVKPAKTKKAPMDPVRKWTLIDLDIEEL